MSKHRTKAQKLKIAAKRKDQIQVSPETTSVAQQTQPVSASLTWSDKSAISKPKTNQTELPKQSFDWRFNPSLIYQDLFKTGLASALVVGILLLIYYLSFSR